MAASWPPGEWRDLTVMVAVSGGPDSVALLRAMHALKLETGGSGRLMVAHFNHHLRPEANDDQVFVSDLAAQLKLPIFHGEMDVACLAKLQGDGLEAAAREARYEFFQRAAECQGARYVATAHTADDQVETVLFNILRGTGLAGVAGMPRARALGPAVSLIRPWLEVRHGEVVQYLDKLGQRYRVDPTNACHDFARNRLRHELLPLLREKYNSKIDGALRRLSQLAGDAQQLIERLAKELLDRCLVSAQNSEVRLNLAPLENVDRHLQREMFVALWRRSGWPLQSMGFTEWNALAQMAQAPESGGNHLSASKRVFPGNVVVTSRSGELLLARPSS